MTLKPYQRELVNFFQDYKLAEPGQKSRLTPLVPVLKPKPEDDGFMAFINPSKTKTEKFI